MADTPRITADMTLEQRFRAAGIPIPPPMSDDEQADWDRRVAEADAQPRVYRPKHRST